MDFAGDARRLGTRGDDALSPRWQRARLLGWRGVESAVPAGFELWVEPQARITMGVYRRVDGAEYTAEPADPEERHDGYPTHYVTELGRRIYLHARAVELLGREPTDFAEDVALVEWSPRELVAQGFAAAA